jgi:hypothetical protein
VDGSFLATFFLAVAPKAYNRSSLPKNIYLPNISYNMATAKTENNSDDNDEILERARSFERETVLEGELERKWKRF